MKIYFLNTLSAGYDLFRIVSKKIKIEGYIGLSNDRDNSDISGYFNAKNTLRKSKTKFYEFETYNLSSSNDQSLIESLEIDVLVVSGWQRLISMQLINQCRVCAIGIHGSPLGINEGRGRSPQNWALIYGLTKFQFSIFKINQGIDSGEIIYSESINLNETDDIRTSYIKTSYLSAQMIVRAIVSGKIYSQGIIQSEELAGYLPQRKIEDGEIDWSLKGKDIFNFVRALTIPYPGAFSFVDSNILRVWKCCVFDQSDLFSSYKIGTVIEVYSNKEIIVKCKDGAVIITEYTFSGRAEELIGKTLSSVSFNNQLARIIKRHEIKYPNMKISSIIKTR